MSKKSNAILIFIASIFSSEVSMAHTGIGANSMLHMSLHVSLAIGIALVMFVTGALIFHKMKKVRIKK